MSTILILTANPPGTAQLELNQEVRDIRQALQLSRHREQFTLEHRAAVQWRDVRREMERVQPEIVHFSGHGVGEAGLVFEADDGSSDCISTDALHRLFELFRVQCVVLNACYSEVQAEAIHTFVPFVVGMNRPIGDRAARKFAEAFYDGIGAGRGYREAFQLGLSGMANDQEVETPVLLWRKASVEGASVTGEGSLGQPSSLGQPGAEPFLLARESPIALAELEEPGGKMAIESRFYVARPRAEEDASREVMRPGGLIRIKAPHEYGKSSLMARVVAQAEASGAKTVSINFREIDREFLGSLNGFLKHFCAQVTRKLRVENRLSDYWGGGLGSKGDCGEYFEDYLLPLMPGTLVLELDEMDVLFEGTGDKTWAIDFLSMLRAWFEKGRTSAQWNKLRLVLVHAKDIDQETLQQSQSPFNVGTEIELHEFNEVQVVDLARRHGLEPSIVPALMALVGGHPQLVRLGLYAIARGEWSIDQLVTDGATEAGLYGLHLRRVRSKLDGNAALKTAFRRVLAGGTIDSSMGAALRGLGLVRAHRNGVQVTCELYRQYFRDVWV